MSSITFTRLKAPVGAALALAEAQHSRIAMFEDTRLSLFAMPEGISKVHLYTGDDRVDNATPAVEICIDGRRVGVAAGNDTVGWYFAITNHDGACVNTLLPAAVDMALRAAVYGMQLDTGTAHVFDRWSDVATATADALSKELFGV